MSGKKIPIDWGKVKSRLRESQQALENALTASPERLAAVYRERAAELARRLSVDASPAPALVVLVFLRGTDRYALNLVDLATILPFANCTPVPGGPPQLLGVTNIEGEIRSVVDLAQLLQLPPQAADNSQNLGRQENPIGYILVVRKGESQVGLRVDGLDQIRRIPPADLSLFDGETGPAIRFLRGWTPDRLKVLSTDAILAQACYPQGATGSENESSQQA
jgi:purine-binding chemotaxis protein CheW